MRNAHVAPPDMIRQELRYFQSKESLRVTWHVEEILFIQSIESHAHTGHGMFKGHRFVNTTMDDVCRALRLDPRAVRAERQQLIEDIKDFAARALSGEKPEALLNRDSEPLLGFGLFRHYRINPLDVLKGLYLGGMRDAAEIRQATEERYGTEIGSGKSYFVNQDVMQAMGLNGNILAKGSHESQLEEYRRRGLIVDGPDDQESVAYMYIRHQAGPGASDDAAIVAAGWLWGLDVALGVFLADAIDTIEKYTSDYQDQDELLAETIRAGHPSLGLTDEDVYKLTYIASTPPGREREVPDSSLRHFLRLHRATDQTAIEAHLLAVQGKPSAPVPLDHQGISSPDFYAYLRQRMTEMPAGN